MDFLKEWVRGLVMLVLLGTCLELLLPMNAMKRYVRMVMGLLVVLAVTRPIFQILGQPVTVDPSVFTEGTGGRPVPTMNEILARAGEFKKKNEALAGDQAKAAMALQAAQAARAVSGVADARAVVELEEKDGESRVRRVTVTVIPGESGAIGVAPVSPVTPVGGRPALGPKPEPRAPAAAEKAMADQVRREVAARLGLSPDGGQVQVLVEAESHGR